MSGGRRWAKTLITNVKVESLNVKKLFEKFRLENDSICTQENTKAGWGFFVYFSCNEKKGADTSIVNTYPIVIKFAPNVFMLFNFEFFETNSDVIRCTSEKLDPNSIYSLSPEKRYRYEKFFQKPKGFNQHWTISMPIFNNFHRTFWYLIWLFRFLIPKRIHQPMLNITYPIFWNPMFILWQGFFFNFWLHHFDDTT